MDERFGRRYEEDERRFSEPAPHEYEYEGRRYRGEARYGGRGWERREQERGFFDRAGDEVRSWFGDEEAERRRREDERHARFRGGPRDDAWGARGPYAGRGPKGYRRSDERIREDVCDLLCEHGALDASGVEVQVVSGEVTLLGIVPSRGQKRLAEDLSDSVSGVNEVHNQLRVNQPAAQDWRDRAA